VIVYGHRVWPPGEIVCPAKWEPTRHLHLESV
jgi:hypothetical protein